MPKWIWFKEQTQPQKYKPTTERDSVFLIQYTKTSTSYYTKFGVFVRERKKLI